MLSRPELTLASDVNLASVRGALRGAPFFVCVLSLWVALLQSAWATGDVVTYSVAGSDYQAVRDALIEVIEAEGLVVGTVLPFNQMLERTGVEGAATPFRQAEIIQFCSGALAWQMVNEAAEQLTLCPLSIALYNKVMSAEVELAYRSLGDGTAGRRQAMELLQRIAKRTVELARLHW